MKRAGGSAVATLDCTPLPARERRVTSSIRPAVINRGTAGARLVGHPDSRAEAHFVRRLPRNSDWPVELIERYDLARFVHERGGEREVRFMRQVRQAVLPIRHHGQLRIVSWGCGQPANELWTYNWNVCAGFKTGLMVQVACLMNSSVRTTR